MRVTNLLWCLIVSSACSPALNGSVGMKIQAFEPSLRVVDEAMPATCTESDWQNWLGLARAAVLAVHGRTPEPTRVGACEVTMEPAGRRIRLSVREAGQMVRTVVEPELVSQIAVISKQLSDTRAKHDAIRQSGLEEILRNSIDTLYQRAQGASDGDWTADYNAARQWAAEVHHNQGAEIAKRRAEAVFAAMRELSSKEACTVNAAEAPDPTQCFVPGRWTALLPAAEEPVSRR